MKRGVIYARYSSNNQTEQSIEGQVKSIEKYAKDNNIEIVNDYIDRARSGKTSDRPAFQNMLRDSEHDEFDTILVYSLDRFSRDRKDSIVFKSQLKRFGISVKSITENITDDATGLLLEGFLETMNAHYSYELRRKVMRGMEISAEKCKATGSAPFGYKIDEEKNYVINKETAPVILEIFTRYNEGYTYTQISESFNSRGIKTSTGKQWNRSSYKSIMKNRRYIGEYKWKDHIVKDGMPRILSNDLFYDVQDQLEKRTQKKSFTKHNIEKDVTFYLSNKITCGYCLALINVESGTSKSKKVHHYYKCETRKRKGSNLCSKDTMKKNELENLVYDVTLKEILNDEVIETVASFVYKEIEKINDNADTVNRLKSNLKEVQKQIANIVKAIEQGAYSKNIQKRLTGLEDQEEKLNRQIRKEGKKLPSLDKTDIELFLYNMIGQSEESTREMIFNTFINKVITTNENITIFYNIADEKDSKQLRKLQVFNGVDFGGAFSPVVEQHKNIKISCNSNVIKLEYLLAS